MPASSLLCRMEKDSKVIRYALRKYVSPRLSKMSSTLRRCRLRADLPFLLLDFSPKMHSTARTAALATMIEQVELCNLVVIIVKGC